MATKLMTQQSMPRTQQQQSMPRVQQPKSTPRQQQRANPQRNVQQSIYKGFRKSDIDRAFKRMA